MAIVWAPEEARTALFARRLGATLHNIHYLQYKRPLVAPIKYIAQWFKTWQVLFSQRPRVVYITNPPIFAVLCVFMYCRLTGTHFVMDTHPPALYSRKWAWTVPLQRMMAKRALMNVTDQERFKKLFESWGARAIVLADPPKKAVAEGVTSQVDPAYFDVLVVNTFAADEPVQPVIDAAKQLPQARFFITGEKTQAPPGMIENAPQNVTFTGYLRKEAYWNQVNSARALIVLTTYQYSLLGGAQDGLAFHKPLILSRQPALQEHFTKGTVFVENTAQGIADGVKEVMAREQQLIAEISQLGPELAERWNTTFSNLLELVRQA
jgi:glycosyltransferase involved in cell wall biosynthesis